MTISNNLEEYVLRLLETRPLESLLDESITQSVTKSLFELKKLDEAAVFDEASMLRNQIITLQQGAQNGGSALTMFSIAKSALNEQLNGLLNIDSSAMKYEKSSPFNENKQNDLDLIKKDLLAIDYISMQTQYNYIKLLDGSFIDKPLLIVPNDQKKVSINFESTNTEQLGKIYATTSTNITNDEAFSLTFNEQTFFSEELQLDGSYHLGTVAEEINEQFDGNLIASFKVSSLGSQSIEATSIDNLSINGIGFGDIEVLDNDSDGGLVAFINGKKNQTQIVASTDTDGKLQLDSLDGRAINVEATSGLQGLHLPSIVLEKVMTYDVNSRGYTPTISSNLDTDLYSSKILHGGFTLNGIVINENDLSINSVDDLVSLINLKKEDSFVFASKVNDRLKLSMITDGDPQNNEIILSYTNKDDVYVLGLDSATSDYYSSYSFSSSRSQAIESGKEFTATDHYMPEFTITHNDGINSISKTISSIGNSSIHDMIAHINSEFGSDIASKKENIFTYAFKYNEEGDLITTSRNPIGL